MNEPLVKMDRIVGDSNDEMTVFPSMVTLVTDTCREQEESCGDLDIRIDREGRWYYRGSPILRRELVCMFAYALRREANGDYMIVTPVERGRIEVEDAPFMAVEIYGSFCGERRTVSLRTNVDEIVSIDEDHPLRVECDPETGEPAPYVMIRDGLEAKLTRSAFYELVDLGQEEETECGRIYGIWSSGQFFPIGKLDDET